MSALAAAFAKTGHGILTGMGTRPRSQAVPPMTLGNMRTAHQGRAVARCVLLAVSPSDDPERGTVARSRASAIESGHGSPIPDSPNTARAR
jgi:hypothetical protein